MTGADPSVVLCWEGDPSYIAPLRLSSRQVTIGLRYASSANALDCPDAPDILVAPGQYDLQATLIKAGWAEQPDLIVVWSSALRANLPVNLGAFRCPKLLICGDTHHMQRPIGFMLDYARSEPFDAVASAYDRQHLHWFLAAGFENCAWLPGITVQHVPMPWRVHRDDQVVFVGQTGAMHAWRQSLLKGIAAAGVPLLAGQATRSQAAELFSQSLVSFNGSLNGDLNMRVFEVLSAGGFLLTDRLSPQAGLEWLLRPGVDCETYRDAAELLDKIAFYRRSPMAALRIAEQGAATYQREHLACSRITLLRRWLLDGMLPDWCNPRHDLRLATSRAAAGQIPLRVALYEMVQESQRARREISVLISPGWPVAAVMDLADLVRTQVSVIGPNPALCAALAAASISGQVAMVEIARAMERDWDIVLTTTADAASEPWRRRGRRVVFADFAGG
ncbi:MAG TPA: glycosyltransferase [Acetobacteraceae bacterium]|nr:glycosyltransferase [Acetobacteraceae bacterium]